MLITHRSTQTNFRHFCFVINFTDNKDRHDILNTFSTTNESHRLRSDFPSLTVCDLWNQHRTHSLDLIFNQPIWLAAQSKAWVYGRSLVGTAVSNPAWAWIFVSSSRALCDGQIPSPEESYRVKCVCVTSKPRQWESLGPLGLSSNEQNNILSRYYTHFPHKLSVQNSLTLSKDAKPSIAWELNLLIVQESDFGIRI